MIRTLRVLPLCLAALACVPSTTRAQAEASAADPIAERSTSFQAVEGSTDEEVSGFGLMVGAYGLILGLLGAYVVRLGRLERTIAADVQHLAARLPAEPTDPR